MPHDNDFNLDPITNEPGAHPVGTGVGAALGGAAAGAVMGTFAGPAGALVGAVAGAFAGGLGGKAAAESVNPTAGEQVDTATDWPADQDAEPKALVYGDVLSGLNNLLEACRDTEQNFRECADNSKAENLKELLERYADETLENMAVLQSHVRELGGKAQDSGSVAGVLQRSWASVRGTLAGYSPESMLSDCKRGQDTLLAAYSQAQEQTLPVHIAQDLEQQAEGVRKNRDRILELQDTLKAAE